RAAGRALASRLAAHGGAGVVVVAIARGGVPVAAEVSKMLGAPLDLVFIRRLLVPRGTESQVCALNVCGTLVVDEELAPRVAVPSNGLDYFVADALGELERLARACRGAQPARDLKGKTVLLVDNGIRTGLTMRSAIRALRSVGPSRVVAAVPVAAPESRAFVETVADELICLAWPEPFGHVGVWYKDFARPGEEEIREALEESERTRT
ncbi:MAG: phosphoribosyltransferase, partial [Acidobacteria bacterium]|nr:phosphoribosyltransferase [Acidobacteriota bacterium]